MRSGFSWDLLHRLRRPDPAARLIVEAVAQDAEDGIVLEDTWEAGTGVVWDTDVEYIRPAGGVRIVGTATNLISRTTSAFQDTSLAGPPGMEGTVTAARVEFAADDDRQLEISDVVAYLDPDTGAGQDVDQWLCQLWSLMADPNGDFTDIDLVPISTVVRVTAGGTPADVTFSFASERPRPLAMIPPGVPLCCYAFFWAVSADGNNATAVALEYDNGDVVSSDRTMTRRHVTWSASGEIDDASQSGAPRVSVKTQASMAAETIEFGAGPPDVRLDLGAVPTNDVEFFVRSITPSTSSITTEVRNDADSAWVAFEDGDLDSDLSGVGKNQTYRVRVTLTPNAAGTVSPIVAEIGVREVTTELLDGLCQVTGGMQSVDPMTLRGETTEVTIAALRDGERDFFDAITRLLTTYDIAALYFRLWWGHPDLARASWGLVDVYEIDGFVPRGAEVELRCLSVLARLRAVLPVYDTGTDTREPLQYTNSTLKDAFDDIFDTQLALPNRFRGIRIDDDTTTVTKRIENSRGKAELDALARLDGGAIIASQGRIKRVDMHGDKPLTAIFPRGEVRVGTVSAGFEHRVPEFFAPWDYDFDEGRFDQEIRRVNVAAFDALGNARLEDVQFLDEAVGQWIDTQALASLVAQRVVDTMGTGLIQCVFTSTYVYPELEPGDLVAVQTDRLVAKDPYTAAAVRGRKWLVGVLTEVPVADWLTTPLTMWVRSFADILSTPTAGTRDLGARPKATSVGQAFDITGGVRVTVITKDAKSVKVAQSTTGFPSRATVQAATAVAVDSDGMAITGVLDTLVDGETSYVSVLAYSKGAGDGLESTLSQVMDQYVEVATPPTPSSITDGFSAARDTAGPENGDVTITTDGGVAHSNLEDANTTETAYNVYYDIDTTAMDDNVLAWVTVYVSDAATGGSFAAVGARGYEAGESHTNELITFNAALNADYDIKIELTHTPHVPTTPATLTAHGEDNAVPGVQYEKLT